MKTFVNHSFLSIALLTLSSSSIFCADKQKGALSQFFPHGNTKPGLAVLAPSTSSVTFGSFNNPGFKQDAQLEMQHLPAQAPATEPLTGVAVTETPFSRKSTPQSSRAPSPKLISTTSLEDALHHEETRRNKCLELIKHHELQTGRSEQGFATRLFSYKTSERTNLMQLIVDVQDKKRDFNPDVDATTISYGIATIINELKSGSSIITIAEQELENARISQCLEDLKTTLEFANTYNIKVYPAVKIGAVAEIKNIDAQRKHREASSAYTQQIALNIMIQQLAKQNYTRHGNDAKDFEPYIGKLSRQLSTIIPAMKSTPTAHQDVIVAGYSHADELTQREEELFSKAITQFAAQSDTTKQS